MRHRFGTLFALCGLFVFALAAGANPTQVFVNAGWTAEHCGGHTWQTDAFAAIQDGIDAVEPGGTVLVAAGVYAERLVIAKSLSLLGSQAGVDPNEPDVRTNPGAEARILPPTDDTTLPGGILVAVKAHNVTVDGFTLDGDNPAFSGAGGVLLNGVDCNAASGIATRDVHVEGLLVAHNIIQNLRCDAVSIVNPGWPVQTSGQSAVLYNRVTNLPKSSWPDTNDMPPVWGTGVWVQRENVRVACNSFTQVATGIDIHFLSSTDGTASPVIASNTIEASQAGIGLHLLNDMTRESGPQALVSNNTITLTACRQTADEFPTAGLSILYIEHQAQILASGNTLSGGDAGVLVWEAPTYNPTNITLSHCTIAGAKYGLWFMNYYPNDQFGFARPSGILFTNVTVANPLVAGIYLEDDPRGDGPVTLTAVGVTVQGGPVGLLKHGPRTVVNGTLNLVGQTVQPIVTEAGAAQ